MLIMDVVELLLSNPKVSCGNRDDMNRNAIHLICMGAMAAPRTTEEKDTEQRLQFITRLRSRGCSVYIKDAIGREAASYAREFHRPEIVDLLVKLGAIEISMGEVVQQIRESRRSMRSTVLELEKENCIGEESRGRLTRQDSQSESGRNSVSRALSRSTLLEPRASASRVVPYAEERRGRQSAASSVKAYSNPADDVNQNE